MTDLLTRSSATISECGTYRYWLERQWSNEPPQVFVMLNPSTADANQDDPTIRRCISFSKREKAGGLIVVNLFAFRATNPRELKTADDPVGKENARSIGEALILSAAAGRPAICAWGANKLAIPQADRLKRRARDATAKLVALRLTKSGAPEHPLYLPADTPLVELP